MDVFRFVPYEIEETQKTLLLDIVDEKYYRISEARALHADATLTMRSELSDSCDAFPVVIWELPHSHCFVSFDLASFCTQLGILTNPRGVGWRLCDGFSNWEKACEDCGIMGMLAASRDDLPR